MLIARIVIGVIAIALFCFAAIRVIRVRTVLHQGAWIIRRWSGAKDIVRRSEQPKRFWWWTAAEIGFAVFFAAMGLVQLWVLSRMGNPG